MPNDVAASVSDLNELPEDSEVTIQELWKQLSLNSDIIIIIDKSDEFRIRNGISRLKSRENAKMKSAGIEGDSSTLEFILPKEEMEDKNTVKMQIVLREKAKIKIHKMIVPKD